MPRTWNDPEGSATLPNRAKIIGKLECADDTKSSPSNQSLAARWVAAHFNLTHDRAALIADLAGLGMAVAGLTDIGGELM